MVVSSLLGRLSRLRPAVCVTGLGAGSAALVAVAAHHFSVMAANPKDAKSIYEFTCKDIDGNDVPLSNYKGRVCIIVNVASK